LTKVLELIVLFSDVLDDVVRDDDVEALGCEGEVRALNEAEVVPRMDESLVADVHGVDRSLRPHDLGEGGGDVPRAATDVEKARTAEDGLAACEPDDLVRLRRA
jgi:hypothetical protein